MFDFYRSVLVVTPLWQHPIGCKEQNLESDFFWLFDSNFDHNLKIHHCYTERVETGHSGLRLDWKMSNFGSIRYCQEQTVTLENTGSFWFGRDLAMKELLILVYLNCK